jgi:hypothetical protein
MVHTQSSHDIRVFCSNSVREYLSMDFHEFLSSEATLLNFHVLVIMLGVVMLLRVSTITLIILLVSSFVLRPF